VVPLLLDELLQPAVSAAASTTTPVPVRTLA
jgi:hypothetical protein